VIVTGQQMPGMTGVEFLSQAKELSPKSMRLMLTGYGELNAAMAAINSSGIYRYILKPWNDDDLKQAVRDAVAYFSLADENRRLTTEISRKNILLEEINSQLEDKITERTQALKDAYDENLVLTRELQARVVELEGRDRILRHLLTIHELTDTLHITLEVICQVASLDWAAVYLPEENHRNFSLAAFHGRKPEADTDIVVAEDTVRQVFIEGEYLLSNENNLSLLFMPVRRSRKCQAVVVAARSWSYLENAMTREEVDKIEQFMAYITIAITDDQVEIDLPAWDDSLDDVLRNYLK
jgi:FixJ family two-component response regulator